MRVKVRASLPRTAADAGRPKADYPLRLTSFAVSLGVHTAVAAALMLVTIPSSSIERPVYDELIKPNEHKILYYDFRRKTPEVRPTRKVGSAREPRGAELSRQTIIATSPKPKSKQVFISVPVPKIRIQEDMPAPILVERLNSIAVAPPPRPKPRQFIPPKPSKAPPKLPIQTPVVDAQAPALVSPTMSSPLAPPRLALAEVAAPPKPARVAPKTQTGNANADIAVASLHPTENADAPVPNGDRPGQFSKAPVQGETASGDASSSAALTVPDLTIRNVKPEAAPKIATEEILYTERVRNIPLATLSVPLRPSSRMIPPAVDAQFKGRNVYTIVIPMEHIAAYTGDWILWFADRGSKGGETPVVRAPVPYRKVEPVNQAPPNERTRERIQLSATLGKNGKLDGITLLTKVPAAVQHAVFTDVTSWQFQPATSDGVAVDVVLEIPFSLPTAIAKGAM